MTTAVFFWRAIGRRDRSRRKKNTTFIVFVALNLGKLVAKSDKDGEISLAFSRGGDIYY